MKDGLKPAEESFAAGIASGLTQAEAYRRAFTKAARWKDETVWAEASRLAADHRVSTRVRELLDKAAAANEVTVERVVRELARIAFFDVRKLVDEAGKPLPLPAVDDDTARALVGLEVVRVGNAVMGEGEVLKFKLADKKGALDTLARHLGLFEKDNKQKADPLAEVLRQLGGSALPVTRSPADE